MAKAEWSCDECGELYPADHFQKVTIREVSSTGSSTRIYKGTRGGVGFGGGSSTRYRHVKMKLCRETCYPAYLDMLARERGRRIRGGLIIALLIGGLVYFIASSTHPGSQAQVSSPLTTDTNATDSLAAPAEADSPGNAVPAPRDSETPEPTKQEATAEDDGRDQRATPEADTKLPVTAAEDDRPSYSRSNAIGGAIAIARIDALEAGKAIAWHADGERGFAVVSSPTTTGDRTCRNVYITNDSAARSATEVWCRAGDGEWERQPG